MYAIQSDTFVVVHQSNLLPELSHTQGASIKLRTRSVLVVMHKLFPLRLPLHFLEHLQFFPASALTFRAVKKCPRTKTSFNFLERRLFVLGK